MKKKLAVGLALLWTSSCLAYSATVTVPYQPNISSGFTIQLPDEWKPSAKPDVLAGGTVYGPIFEIHRTNGYYARFVVSVFNNGLDPFKGKMNDTLNLKKNGHPLFTRIHLGSYTGAMRTSVGRAPDGKKFNRIDAMLLGNNSFVHAIGDYSTPQLTPAEKKEFIAMVESIKPI